MKDWQVGKTYAVKGFVSAGELPLRSFLREGSTAIEISVKKGDKVLSGFNADELEHLLPHNARMEVVAIKETPYRGIGKSLRTIQVVYHEPEDWKLGVTASPPAVVPEDDPIAAATKKLKSKGG